MVHFLRKFVVVAFISTQLVFVSEPSMADTRSNASSWLRQNTLAPKDAFMVNRVQMIFEDIKRASDSFVYPANLYIIQSKGTPWAIALEDRNVILTSGAIDVIYSGNDSLAMKDARMAFVLGHELKHVIENDFSHERAYNNFSATGVSDLIDVIDNQTTTRKTLELLADEEGLITASLAGYDTTAIFSDIGDSGNFLEYWAAQTNTRNDKLHHSPKERIDYLKASYQSIYSQLEFFKYGVRLAHFGQYESAQILLEDFYKVYESDRVLTSRGYVHLQLARNEMPKEIAYQYWYPDLLETNSGFPFSAPRTVYSKLSETAIRHLNEAVALLSKGLNKDSSNETAKLNLISAHLLLGEYSAARAIIEKIDGWDKNPELIGLDALIEMQNTRIKDPWNTYSVEKFAHLAAKPDVQNSLLYNYARLLSEHGRKEKAHPFWTRLASKLGELPKEYQVMVCRQLKEKETCFEKLEQFGIENLHWKLKITPGDLINSEKVRVEVNKWREDPIESYSGIDAKIFPDGEGNSLLVIDGEVKLISLTQHGIDFKDVLLNRFGKPMEIITNGLDEIWSYGSSWSALVAGNHVREIWIAK